MHELDDPTQAKYSNAPSPSLVEEGMVLQLADGTIQACNASAEKLLGLTTEQILGWTSANFPWQAIHEDGSDFPGETHPAMIALQTGEPQFNVVMGLYHPDGDLIWLQIDAQPLFQASGTRYGVISKFRQIPSRQEEEHKRIFELLREDASRLELIQQSTKSGIWDWDFATNIAYISQQYCTILGLAPQKRTVSYDQWLKNVHPDDQVWVSEQIAEAIKQGKDYAVEYRILHPDGVRWIDSRGQVYYDSSNQPVRMLGNVQDITDRKAAEVERLSAQTQLQDQQERLQAALFASETGTFRWDIRTNALDWDDNLDRLFGLPPGQTARSLDAFIDMVHPSDRQGVIDLCQRCATEGADFDMDFRVVYPDGSIRWLSDKGKTFFDQDGIPTYMTGACVDITERKYAEEALRQSEEFKDRMLESSPDCIKVLDLDGRLLYMNTGGMCVMEIDDFTPYCNTEWVGFWEGDDRQQAQQALAAVKVGKVSIFQGYCPTAKGTLKCWEVIVSPIVDARGQVEQVLSISRDITERKQALEAAERANRIKDEFLAVLSHELRTPLNPIMGWVKLLRGGRLTATKTTEAYGIIERNAKLQSQLIEDLLDVSRILRGKMTLNAVPVNMAAIITAALETVRLSAEAKNIQLELHLSEVRPIIGDAGRLQQVIWNLLTNAIKFTPNNGRVEVYLTHRESHVQIQVRDTGKGISSEFIPYVFEHFRQEDGGITRKFGGLGLGLAITRQIVEMHGGSVQVESPGEEKGATFTVTLPLPKQTLATPNQDSSPLVIAMEAPLAGIRALVVDDDPDSRDYVAFVLEQAGAEVVQTSSAIEGLQILTKSEFDILLSDIGMPEMDGYTFMRLLGKRLASSSGLIPAIALTAYAGEFDQRQAISAGFQRHLPKPVDPEQLAEVVLTLVIK